MNTFSLDSKNSQIAFKLQTIDSYLHIDTITLISSGGTGNEWIKILSKLALSAELKYLVYSDNGLYPDTRSIYIPITIEPSQLKPIFKINRTIKNQPLTIGINTEKKFYSTLMLELKEIETISEKYELKFEVRLHEIAKVIN